MGAHLKSSVLRREERGFGSISMGRLIISGMVGGMSFFVMRLIGLSILMIPAGLIVFIACLILTNLKHGIPLYHYFFITLRARLIMDAAKGGNRWTVQIVKLLELNTDILLLDTGKLLSAPSISEEEGGLDEWEIVPNSEDLTGFELVTDSVQLEVNA